ncbi:DUF397 domain-containing protein [Actinacidiphila yeochonensis]|uniref:DUF397 domain-containing protein n=1 Tax=Actinacidiphila yeochonensis TaxID=89050 RepID=UPI00055E58BA|nr:DUF397 domain-containing protein [Actinacidiphila yeochonensis]
MTLKPSTGGDAVLAWTKSSYSTNDGGDCVEAATVPSTVLVRDSKDPEGPHLTVTVEAWTSFVAFAAAAEV